jgi:hypothetical protein
MLDDCQLENVYRRISAALTRFTPDKLAPSWTSVPEKENKLVFN